MRRKTHHVRLCATLWQTQGMGEVANNTPLASERLTLVPLGRSHIRSVRALWTDAEVRRYLFDGEVISLPQAENMVASNLECFASHGVGLYALVERVTTPHGTESLMGFCGVRVFKDGETMELLYGIYPRYWGKGLIHEAATAVLAHVFNHCEIGRVIAATDTPNQRSVSVMQRLGMSFSERREWHGLDTVFYDITAADFAAT